MTERKWSVGFDLRDPNGLPLKDVWMSSRLFDHAPTISKLGEAALTLGFAVSGQGVVAFGRGVEALWTVLEDREPMPIVNRA